MSGNFAIWTILELGKLLFWCFWVPQKISIHFCSHKCFSWFPAAILVPIRMGTSMASPYKSPEIWYKASSRVSHKKKCCDLNLEESLHIYPLSFFRFWTLSIEQFCFYLDLFWMAWHWKPERLHCLTSFSCKDITIRANSLSEQWGKERSFS